MAAHLPTSPVHEKNVHSPLSRETGSTFMGVHVSVTPNCIPWCPPDSQRNASWKSQFIEDNVYERHPHSRHFATHE